MKWFTGQYWSTTRGWDSLEKERSAAIPPPPPPPPHPSSYTHNQPRCNQALTFINATTYPIWLPSQSYRYD
ncbi:Hypothetical predicted protein [Octopus vulgaris]|uniref:Uncharacterized protein n=1 Tax=Octopus vulgaris TaxID=6645 RepID=A0AA36AYK7_OCTVU|nr:Hypothetical predicted protein [Octopus vulgaris]